MERVNTSEMLAVKKTLMRFEMLDDFEQNFMNSITSDKNIRFRDYKYNSLSYHLTRSIKKEVTLTDKQYKVYQRIRSKTKEVTIFERYTDLFKEKGIKLSAFDAGYLEAHVNEYAESKCFKDWLREILT